jgi:hypothetical protein
VVGHGAVARGREAAAAEGVALRGVEPRRDDHQLRRKRCRDGHHHLAARPPETPSACASTRALRGAWRGTDLPERGEVLGVAHPALGPAHVHREPHAGADAALVRRARVGVEGVAVQRDVEDAGVGLKERLTKRTSYCFKSKIEVKEREVVEIERQCVCVCVKRRDRKRPRGYWMCYCDLGAVPVMHVPDTPNSKRQTHGDHTRPF